MGAVSIAAVFAAGVLSFASPCVAALVPAYVSYVSGISLADLGTSRHFVRVMTNSLLFCVGFAVVFVTLGATASFLGKFLFANRILLARIGGAIVVLFGLHVLGVLRIPFLNREARLSLGKITRGGYLQSPLVGMSFAIGWTPCLGTILASVLLLASQAGTAARGATLLGMYSAGLAIPFLAVAAALSRGLDVSFMRRHARTIEIVSGILLILFGLLIFSGRLQALTGSLSGLGLRL